MTDENFRALCNTYGFAPSRALREMLEVATAQAAIDERSKSAGRVAAPAGPTTEEYSAVEPAQEPATLPGPGLIMCPDCCAQFDPALNRVQAQEPEATMTVREDMGVDFFFNGPHTLRPGQQFHLHRPPLQRKEGT